MTRRVVSQELYVYVYPTRKAIRESAELVARKPRNPQIHSPWWGWRTWFHLGTAAKPLYHSRIPPWFNPCFLPRLDVKTTGTNLCNSCSDQALLLTRTFTYLRCLHNVAQANVSGRTGMLESQADRDLPGNLIYLQETHEFCTNFEHASESFPNNSMDQRQPWWVTSQSNQGYFAQGMDQRLVAISCSYHVLPFIG